MFQCQALAKYMQFKVVKLLNLTWEVKTKRHLNLSSMTTCPSFSQEVLHLLRDLNGIGVCSTRTASKDMHDDEVSDRFWILFSHFCKL